MTLARKNDEQYCTWLSTRLCETLAKAGVPINDDVREKALAFARTLPEHKTLPPIY